MELSDRKLTELFRPASENLNKIFYKEGKTIEYKESYNHAGMAQYFKTMASFANSEGGYIIFGIRDNPREYLGLNDKAKNQFKNIKIEEFTNNLNEYFQPEILWKHRLFKFRKEEFGVIYTYKLNDKPCICLKNYDAKGNRFSLKEGDIYYRYCGRTERIRYPELKQIFIDKERKQTELWIDLIKKTAKIGVENASLLDLKCGKINIEDKKVVIDEKLLKELRFIEEGNFSEKEGAPTLKLIGNIDGIAASKVISKTEFIAIEQKDIINAFLLNENVKSPTEYIKSALNCTSGFQPIYYFMNLAKMKPDELLEYIENQEKIRRNMKIMKQRLSGRREKFKKLIDTGTKAYLGKKEYLDIWINFEIDKVDFNSLEDNSIKWLLQAFYSIDDEFLVQNQNTYKKIIKNIYDKYFIKSTGSIAGLFRKILCRLDELIYLHNVDHK